MLKKINRGLALTVGVCVVIFIYIASVTFIRNAEMKNIEKAVKNFIDVEVSSYLLPEESRRQDGQISESELGALIERNNRSFDACFAEGVYESKYIKELSERKLRQQTADPNALIYDYQKSFVKTEESRFMSDKVELSVRTSYTIRSAGQNGTFESIDRYILRKINGEWKIIYMFPGSDSYMPADSAVFF